MNEYIRLKKKWQNAPENKALEENFNHHKLEPNRFCVFIHDAGGQMPCGMFDGVIFGHFTSMKEALAFLRFYNIPRILDYEAGVKCNRGLEKAADEYLSEYDDDMQSKLKELLRVMDTAIRSESPSNETFSDLVDKFNAIFSSTNPMNEITAWGSLSDSLKDIFDSVESLDQEDPEDPCADSSTLRIRSLLDAGKFDENKEEHLNLAIDFIDDFLMRFV